MGSFGDLIDKLDECKNMFKQYTESDIASEKFAAIEIINSSLLVKTQQKF